jgi:ATP-dependent RNA helicase RhlE
VNIKYVKHLIIDEVDEMLDLGFRTQLTRIFEMMSPKRQNLLFSATMSEEVDELINEYFRAPITIEVVRMGTPLERIEQKAYFAHNFYTKINLLEQLLEGDESMQKVLVFAASKKQADIIYQRLEKKFPGQFDLIHGNKSQNYRLQAVQQFAEGAIRGLIATDILARGIDVSDVTHVINVDTPADPETYIHRIGRTGRADRDGNAIILVAHYEEDAFFAIQLLMEKELPLLDMPESVGLATQLLEEERYTPTQKNYLPEPKLRGGGFHEKKEKNKKVNLGNRRINAKKAKYKKPISKGGKKR